MIKLKFLILLMSIILLFSCKKQCPTEAPPDNNSHPQVDIPWPSLADSPWPCARGNMQCTARSPFKGPRLGIVEWEFTDSLFRNGVSAPVIGEDGTIYFTAEYDFREHRLYAVKSNGKLKWFAKLDGPSSSTPMIGAGDIIYFGGKNFYYSFLPDGTLNWKYESENSWIESFNDAIGLDGTIYFTDSIGFLYALSPSGSLLWKTKGKKGFINNSYNSMAFSVDGSTIYLVGTDTTLNAIDANTGDIMWNRDLGGNNFFCAPMIDNDGNIYVIKTIENTPKIVSYNSKGEKRWESEVNAYPISTMYLDNLGNIYFKSGDLLCSINYHGKFRWSKDIRIDDTYLSFYPIIGDNEGAFYCALNKNYILSFDRDGNKLFECNISNTWTGLIPGAISKSGRLYVCGKYKLICIK